MNQEQNNFRPQDNNSMSNEQTLDNPNFNNINNTTVKQSQNISGAVNPQPIVEPIMQEQQLNSGFIQPIIKEVAPQPNNMVESGTESNLNNKPQKKRNTGLIIVIMIAIALIFFVSVFFLINNKTETIIEKNDDVKEYSYHISGNSLEDFDLYFLQIENGTENKIYSPLSIKYALEMLAEGATGDSKTQISSVIGEYEAKKYVNSRNMSFANSIFIKDTYKDSINDNYVDTLRKKYNAAVNVDSFATPDNINSWVRDNTLGLINNLFDDVSSNDFLLINALGIDMEWEQKFMLQPGLGINEEYIHEKFSWHGDSDIVSKEFKDNEENVAGMEIIASFNNYDIVNDLGEENIRQTVKAEFQKYLQENTGDTLSNYFSGEDITGLTDDELMEKYLDNYITGINSNYKREKTTTDFSFYVDDNVKAFSKNLKQYNGTTLQYVAIMPVNENLDSYITDITATDINAIIGNLKELKADNFNEGVVTKITGFVPKFKFEYDLDLKEDLKKLGITNVFKPGQSNLTNISTDNSLFINNAIHKANIELTQDGIKASAATAVGGYGAAGAFDYLFEVPVEEIDLTFDKPFMFIIRDKNSGEVWFTGTVYNPLAYTQDTTINFESY